MSELRKDPILDRWVIVSTERGRRPSDFGVVEEQRSGSFCPFCYGSESKTPPEILAFRPKDSAPNSPGWWLRVVPNKFPALGIEGNLNREGVGVYDKMNGVGAHEVIIDSPDHHAHVAILSDKQARDMLWAYRLRFLDLKKDARFRYILLFRNHGSAAGASLEHGHSQLIAIPIVPKRVMEEVAGTRRYYDFKERCIFCDMIRQETESSVRLVCENAHFIAFVPFAARFPFETWILPKQHESHFENIAEDRIKYLAEILKETLARISIALTNPPYNYVIHTSPCADGNLSHYHWHIEIMPKLTKVAGFEWGTGFYINPTPPEEAAEFLREVEL